MGLAGRAAVHPKYASETLLSKAAFVQVTGERVPIEHNLLTLSRMVHFEGIQFPRRLVMLQEHWQLPYFLEALPFTREELVRLSHSRGVVAEAVRHGVRLSPPLEGEE